MLERHKTAGDARRGSRAFTGQLAQALALHAGPRAMKPSSASRDADRPRLCGVAEVRPHADPTRKAELPSALSRGRAIPLTTQRLANLTKPPRGFDQLDDAHVQLRRLGSRVGGPGKNRLLKYAQIRVPHPQELPALATTTTSDGRRMNCGRLAPRFAGRS